MDRWPSVTMLVIGASAVVMVARQPLERSEARMVLLAEFLVLLVVGIAAALFWGWVYPGH